MEIDQLRAIELYQTINYKYPYILFRLAKIPTPLKISMMEDESETRRKSQLYFESLIHRYYSNYFKGSKKLPRFLEDLFITAVDGFITVEFVFVIEQKKGMVDYFFWDRMYAYENDGRLIHQHRRFMRLVGNVEEYLYKIDVVNLQCIFELWEESQDAVQQLKEDVQVSARYKKKQIFVRWIGMERELPDPDVNSLSSMMSEMQL